MGKNAISAAEKPAAKRKKRNAAIPGIVIASEANNAEGVKAALKADPYCINAQDQFLMTALHWAGANGNLEIANILFSHAELPVDPWIKDKFNRFAINLAMRCGNSKVTDLIQQHMLTEEHKDKASASGLFSGKEPAIKR